MSDYCGTCHGSGEIHEAVDCPDCLGTGAGRITSTEATLSPPEKAPAGSQDETRTAGVAALADGVYMADADFVLRWLKQSGSAAHLVALQERALSGLAAAVAARDTAREERDSAFDKGYCAGRDSTATLVGGETRVNPDRSAATAPMLGLETDDRSVPLRDVLGPSRSNEAYIEWVESRPVSAVAARLCELNDALGAAMDETEAAEERAEKAEQELGAIRDGRVEEDHAYHWKRLAADYANVAEQDLTEERRLRVKAETERDTLKEALGASEARRSGGDTGWFVYHWPSGNVIGEAPNLAEAKAMHERYVALNHGHGQEFEVLRFKTVVEDADGSLASTTDDSEASSPDSGSGVSGRSSEGTE